MTRAVHVNVYVDVHVNVNVDVDVIGIFLLVSASPHQVNSWNPWLKKAATNSADSTKKSPSNRNTLEF